MSSYLSFYLVPKKTRKTYGYNEEEGHTEKEIKISEGKPILFLAYSRSSDIYHAYNDILNPAYCGMEEKYTDVTVEDSKRVVAEYEKTIKKTEERLAVSYKMLKEAGYSSELWEDIQSTEEYLKEEKSVLEELKFITFIIEETEKGFNEFERVLINVD